jgi:hypothetical protein
VSAFATMFSSKSVYLTGKTTVRISYVVPFTTQR